MKPDDRLELVPAAGGAPIKLDRRLAESLIASGRWRELTAAELEPRIFPTPEPEEPDDDANG